MMERIKLFSTPTSRIKLFSKGEGERCLVCQDCGYKFMTDADTTNQLCPKCGGIRFNLATDINEEDKFKKEFEDTSDPVEMKLKKFSGLSLSAEKFNKEFSALGITAEDLQEKNFAIIEEGTGNVTIGEDSFLKSRLFSKLIVSLTKTLELDPAVTMSAPEVGIKKLEGEVSDLSPKSIAIIKKVHGIGMDANCKENWLRDSGIEGDLKFEYGNSTMPESKFKALIEKRYPDAPENLIDILASRGIIRKSGENFEIIK